MAMFYHKNGAIAGHRMAVGATGRDHRDADCIADGDFWHKIRRDIDKKTAISKPNANAKTVGNRGNGSPDAFVHIRGERPDRRDDMGMTISTVVSFIALTKKNEQAVDINPPVV